MYVIKNVLIVNILSSVFYFVFIICLITYLKCKLKINKSLRQYFFSCLLFTTQLSRQCNSTTPTYIRKQKYNWRMTDDTCIANNGEDRSQNVCRVFCMSSFFRSPSNIEIKSFNCISFKEIAHLIFAWYTTIYLF